MSAMPEPSLSARPVYLELCAHGVDLEKGETTSGLNRKIDSTLAKRLNTLLERYHEELARIVVDKQDKDLRAIREEATL